MYLTNEILINQNLGHTFGRRNTDFKLPIKLSNYKHLSLVEENIEIFEKDWINLTKDNEIIDGDVLFIQHCNIPEFKLKEKYPNISITKDLTKANKFVISDSILSRIYNFKVQAENQIFCLEDKAIRSHLWRQLPVDKVYKFFQFRKLNLQIPKEHKFIYFKDKLGADDRSIYWRYPLVYLKAMNTPSTDELMGTQKQIKYVESLLKAKENNIPFVMESTVLVEFNKKSNVIDKEFYESLKTMLESENVKDRAMAFEIMANCDLSKSRIYALILLNRYYPRSSYRANIPKMKRSNNYKAMLAYLGVKPANLTTSWNSFIEFLLKHYNLSADEKLVLKEHILLDLNEVCGDLGFTVNDITFEVTPQQDLAFTY